MDDKVVNTVPPPANASRPALSEAEIERRRGRPWTLTVVGAANVTPRMRRVRLTADNLEEFRPRAGQEIVLQIAQGPGEEPARRHYTIRNFDPKTRLVDVDFVLHGGHTPGVRWALDAKPGEAIDIRGPRGRIGLAADADWHLFSGDETALPAIFGMLEALPAGAPAHVFLEIGDDRDKQPLDTPAAVSLNYLPRHGGKPGPSRILIDAIEGFALPPGRGHAIIIGETSNVRAQRQNLLARGLGKDQIYAEGYWRPGRIGGHDHVDQ